MATATKAPPKRARTRHTPPEDTTGGCDGQGASGTDHQPTPDPGPESTPLVCQGCQGLAERLVRAYWGPELCPDCCRQAEAERDGGRWPTPWWEVATPPHLAALGPTGLWRCNEHLKVPTPTLERLGAVCEEWGITQVWVHASALERLGLPAELPTVGRGVPIVHPFTEARGEWQQGGAGPGLKPWGYWYRRGGHGFDLHVPAWGRAVWLECESAPELLAQVARFDHATGGVAWKGNGTITSDVMLRRRLRKNLEPTRLPPPVASGQAHEVPKIWHRPALPTESRMRWCHALDLNLAYAAGASSLPLPTGDFEHHEWPAFNPKVAGVYLIEEGEGTRWVTAPTMQRLDAAGVAALEGYTWPTSRRRLRAWYETIRDARTELLADGGPALVAVKDVCREGLGRLASKVRTIPQGAALEDDPTYQPYWAWAVIAEVRERLLTRVAALEVEPVAIDTDCLYFLSSRASPSHLAVALGLPLGDGLGHFKPAGTCRGADARAALGEPRTSHAVAQLRELCK